MNISLVQVKNESFLTMSYISGPNIHEPLCLASYLKKAFVHLDIVFVRIKGCSNV